jgi:sirohydrochlorin ferrochelatase
LIDCSRTAELLARRIDRPVTVCYLSGVGERLPDVLDRIPGRVAVATYLLTPGFFANRVRHLAGARTVAAPLGADPRLAALALRRYDEARVLAAPPRTVSVAACLRRSSGSIVGV